MKALVLSGGGARGAFEAGFICGWKDVQWDVICGTSAGAINGSFAAQDSYDELQAVWSTIGSKGVLQLVPSVQHAKQFLTDVSDALGKHRPFEVFSAVGELMKVGSVPLLLHELGAIDPQPITQILAQYLKFEKLKRRFVVTATNITTRTADTFYFIPDAGERAKFASMVKPGKQRYQLLPTNYVSAVQASTSIPGAFRPVDLAPTGAGAYQYVDGGVANNTPIGMAIDAGADDVTVLFMDPIEDPAAIDGAPGSRANSLADVGVACFNVMQAKILEDDFKLAKRTNEAVAGAGSAGHKQVTIREIRPAQALTVTVLDFDKQDRMDSAFSAGMAVAKGTPPPP